MRILNVIFVAMLLFPVYSNAFTCNDMPSAVTAVNHDVKSDIKLNIGRLGPVSAGQLSSETVVVAKNLYDKYPDVNKLLLAQTMIATYCSMLKEASFSESEKLDRWEKFQDKVLNLSNIPPDFPHESSLEPLMKFGFNKSYPEIAENVSLNSHDDGRQFIRFTQNLIGKNFNAAQGLVQGRTNILRLWRTMEGSVDDYDGTTGDSKESISDECSKSNFNVYIAALSTKLGTPTNLQPEKDSFSLEDSINETTRGAFWKLTNNEKALLYFSYLDGWRFVRHDGREYKRNYYRCSIQFCAIPKDSDRVCFEIPGIAII